MASEWQERTLGELVAVHRQQVNPAAHPDKIFHHYSIPSYDAGLGPSVESGRSILSNKFLVTSDAVLVSKLNPRIPRVWTPNVIVDGLAIASTEFLVLRPQKWVDRRFLHFLLLSPAVRDELVACATGTSGSHQRVPPEQLLSLQVRIPPLAEQRAIAHILGTLDDKIELNRRMVRTLEEMARALFKAWFVDFEPVRAKMDGRWRPGESLPGLPAHLYDLFPDRLVDSELGPIPEGWEVGRLGDVAEHPRRGVRPSDMDAETPYIGLEHMPRRSIALSDWGSAGAVASNKFEFKRGEILFGKLRPYFHKVGVAPVDGVCSTDIVVLKPRDAGWFAYLLCHVSHTAFVEFTSAGSTGTRMPRTSWSQMARYPLVLPPGSVAAAFLVQVQSAVDQILAGIHESRTLAGLRDALLPRLVSGEVRVTDPDRILVEADRSDV